MCVFFFFTFILSKKKDRNKKKKIQTSTEPIWNKEELNLYGLPPIISNYLNVPIVNYSQYIRLLLFFYVSLFIRIIYLFFLFYFNLSLFITLFISVFFFRQIKKKKRINKEELKNSNKIRV